jgi:hypothetical protein
MSLLLALASRALGGPGFNHKDGWFEGETEIPFDFRFDSAGLWIGQ